MEAQVAAALEISDYQQAAKLLKQWRTTDPHSPMLRLYAAQLQERTNRLEAAEKNYAKLLKQTPSGKIMAQARAGITRIQQQQKSEKAAALSRAKQVEGGNELAILAIAPPSPEHRQQAIAHFAHVFNLDAYSARLKVPTSGCRLYRVGPWGEISYFAQSLQPHTPTLSGLVKDIKAIQTLQICYFEALTPSPIALFKNSDGQLGKISFEWSQVTQRVSGQLPIFEQVIDLGNWGRTVHKEKVQDYTQVLDLHLSGRKMILRLCDRLYHYQKGISLTDQSELNSRIQWNQLLMHLNQSLTGSHQNQFNHFGQAALEFIPLLPPIPAHLDLDRRAPSDWDLAFHLYSSLYYLKQQS
ncbi:MAG: cyclic nucleotide-binding protein [Phormidesmis priestleyi]|uniref:Cyclic nucleotide-binding protein n=1 Tax=Phormidesmis priestleyi TaxID=268141 RepID=A0A2W4XXP0_9CYAN|nr:MAG: cyclic nucleotide-binding protein [Phormidesmis priestleyi]